MARAFLVGANIAWLNPDPDAAAYRPFDAPILWQYDADAGLEIVSAAYFPDAFLQYPERISRPGYPAVVHALGTAVAAVVAPIRELSPLEAAGAGYLTLKLIVVLWAVFAAFDLLRRHIDDRAALLAAMLLTLHPLVLEYSTTFHTTELQLLGPILVLRAVMWAMERHDRRVASGRARHGSVIDAGLVGGAAGLLMLAKPVLVAPLAVLVTLVLFRRLLEAAAAVSLFVLPQVLSPLLLAAAGIPYRNWEVETYGQGVWLMEAAREGPTTLFGAATRLLPDLVVAVVVDFHGVLVPLAVIAIWSGWVRFDRRAAAAVVLMLLAAVAQFVAVRRSMAYMTADLGIVVFGAAAAAIVRGLDALAARGRRATVVEGRSGDGGRRSLPRGGGAVLAAWVAFGIAVLGNLPWVAPWDQRGRDSAVLEVARSGAGGALRG